MLFQWKNAGNNSTRCCVTSKQRVFDPLRAYLSKLGGSSQARTRKDGGKGSWLVPNLRLSAAVSPALRRNVQQKAPQMDAQVSKGKSEAPKMKINQRKK